MQKLSLSTCLGLALLFAGCSEQPAPVASEADILADPGTAVTEMAAAVAAPADPAELQQPVSTEGQSVALAPGNAAPPLSLASIVQGAPAEEFQAGKVYVVEFWATWCGPCLQSMPHISALQNDYADQVQFIGITRENAATVDGFMKKTGAGGRTWSEILTYTIALDQNDATNNAYMRAAEQNGIPCAFIVGKSGTVEWIGHPMRIDQPLQQVVDGTWDVTASRRSFLDQKEADIARQQINTRISQAIQSGDYAAAVQVVDELLTQYQDNATLRTSLQMARLKILFEGNMIEEYNSSVAGVIDSNFDNSRLLNELAWAMATELGEGRDLDLAMKAARQASTLTDDSDASILDTVARVFYEQGNVAEAIAWQERAITASPSTAELKATLQKYQSEAK